MDQTVDRLFQWQTVATRLKTVGEIMLHFVDDTNQKKLMQQFEQAILLPFLSQQTLSHEQELFMQALLSEDPEQYYQTALELTENKASKDKVDKLLQLGMKKNHVKSKRLHHYLKEDTFLFEIWISHLDEMVCQLMDGHAWSLKLGAFTDWDRVQATVFLAPMTVSRFQQYLEAHFENLNVFKFKEKVKEDVRTYLKEHDYVEIAQESKSQYDNGNVASIFVHKDFVSTF